MPDVARLLCTPARGAERPRGYIQALGARSAVCSPSACAYLLSLGPRWSHTHRTFAPWWACDWHCASRANRRAARASPPRVRRPCKPRTTKRPNDHGNGMRRREIRFEHARTEDDLRYSTRRGSVRPSETRRTIARVKRVKRVKHVKREARSNSQSCGDAAYFNEPATQILVADGFVEHYTAILQS